MRKIFLLAVATLMQGTSVGVLIPVLTHQVLWLGASQTLAPAIFSIYSLMAFFSAIFWGRLSDSIGRRKVLIAVAIGTTFSYLWLAKATVLWEVFASRAIAGLLGGWIVCAFAYVTDCTTEENRAKGMGMVGAFFATGFILGPGVASVLVDKENYGSAGLGAGVISFISVLMVTFIIKEPAVHKKIKSISLRQLWNTPNVSTVLAIAFFINCIFTIVEGSYALYLYKTFNTTVREIGYLLAVAGIFHIYVQGRWAHILVNRYGEIWTICLSLLITALGLITTVYIEVFGMYIPITLVGIGMGLFSPSINAIASKKAPKQLKGSISGAVQSALNLARILGPAFAGWTMAKIYVTFPYVLAIVLCSVPLALLYTLYRQK